MRSSRQRRTRARLIQSSAVLIGGLLLVAFLNGVQAPAEPSVVGQLAPPAGPTTHRAAIVIDGDTLMARPLDGGRDVKVRLLRINTPERGQPGYQEATDELKRLVFNKEIRLEFEGPREDRNGRTLAYVWQGNENVCIKMVESGWTKYDSRFGEGRYSPQFKRAEREAFNAKRGLWAN